VILIKYVLIKIITIYQKIPGPWHKSCVFLPTCSEYAKGVISNFGTIKGSILAIKRIIRCKKKESFQYDPIPMKGEKNK